MDRFEFYKEIFYKENDKKNEINGSLAIPIGILSFIAGSLYFFISTFDLKGVILITVIFILGIVVSSVYLALSICHLIKSLTNFHNGYGYAYLPNADQLEKAYQDMKSYNNEKGINVEVTDSEYEEELIERMIAATAVNQKLNIKKIKFRFKCQKHMITSFIFLCCCLAPFSYNSLTKKTETKPIEVIVKSVEKL